MVERVRADVGALMRALRNHQFNFNDEAELQRGIALALETEGIAFLPEHWLSSRDRIDFLVGVLGVEVKIKGVPNAVIRQVHRYAQIVAIEAVVVITGSMKVAAALPDEMNGKPIYVHSIAGDSL